MTAVVRLLAAATATVLLLSSAVAISRSRAPDLGAAAEVAAPSPSPPPPPGSSSPTPAVRELPTDPEEAEALGGDGLLAVGLATARGPWNELGDPAWPVVERPVYVARATLSGDRRQVVADVAIGVRAEEAADELVLRLLPAAEALGANGLEVTVRRDGRDVDARVDRDGARLLVPLDPPLEAADATVVRVELRYDLTAREEVVDDGGPAGFGLLAWNPDVSSLGHWLPLLTEDRGPMVPWGDVGAFPAAVWSVVVTGGGTVVTGAEEADCPASVGRTDGPCVWARGVALRDVSAVAYDRDERVEVQVGDVTVRAIGPAGAGLELDGALAVAGGSTRSFLERFGPLAWDEVDVAAAPLSAGAAGMEFPGLLLIDTDAYDDLGGGPGFGAFVVAHEVAHQWFHALVGNGSLSSPVVDESLAQYLSFLYWADAFGDTAARDLAASAFAGRYDRALVQGLEPEPPAQPLDEFAGSEAYGALVYGRAPLAWVAAEQAVGRPVVVGFLAEVVERFGLGSVDDDELLAFARSRAPAVAEALEQVWFDPGPLR